MEGGKGLELLGARVQATIARAAARPELAGFADALGQAFGRVTAAIQAAWSTGNPAEALVNAVPYMQAFGHMVLAWMWLDVADKAIEKDNGSTSVSTTGRLGAATYFYRYELPKIGAWLNVVESREPVCADLPEDAF